MAELGDFSSEMEGNDAPATVDMCDYGYVNECNDKKKLSGILRLLRSGKEGFYPEVIIFLLVCFPISMHFSCQSNCRCHRRP